MGDSFDLDKAMTEVRAHLRLQKRGIKPDKITRFALAAAAEEALNKAMLPMLARFEANIAETNAMYMKLAKQSAERIEEVLLAQRDCKSQNEAILRELAALKRDRRMDQAKAVVKLLVKG